MSGIGEALIIFLATPAGGALITALSTGVGIKGYFDKQKETKSRIKLLNEIKHLINSKDKNMLVILHATITLQRFWRMYGNPNGSNKLANIVLKNIEKERDPGQAAQEAWTGPRLSVFLCFSFVFLSFLTLIDCILHYI